MEWALHTGSEAEDRALVDMANIWFAQPIQVIHIASAMAGRIVRSRAD